MRVKKKKIGRWDKENTELWGSDIEASIDDNKECFMGAPILGTLGYMSFHKMEMFSLPRDHCCMTENNSY